MRKNKIVKAEEPIIEEKPVKAPAAEEKINVVFTRSYIGTLGNFIKGKKYSLTKELFNTFKNDVKIED